jgi:phosphate transport system substrate-binding protein
MSNATGERRRTLFRSLLLITAAVLAVLSIALGACKSSKTTTTATKTVAKTSASTAAAQSACPPAGSATSLTGAGATFPAPLYTKWIAEYRAKCNVEINYQAIGSGGGITNIQNKTVDFGASDAIMSQSQEQTAVASGGPILHIPMTIGGIAVVMNLPGITQGQVKLTPDVLAKIFLGQVTKWNDPAITALNSGVTLPSSDIAVVHRSDGSGTTFLFTDYLSKVSTAWQAGPGSGTTVNWPVGVGGEKNDGVAAQVNQLPGAIGYVEVAYAVKTNMIWASIKNKAGNYVQPTLAAISAAADGVTLRDDMKVLIDDSSNPNAYPISGFSWLLVYTNQTDQAKAQTLANYMWWAIHDGQSLSEALVYAKLPAGAVTKAEAQIKSITVSGSPVTFQ